MMWICVNAVKIKRNDYANFGAKKLLKYEGWNFNSGNYLFTTDTK